MFARWLLLTFKEDDRCREVWDAGWALPRPVLCLTM